MEGVGVTAQAREAMEVTKGAMAGLGVGMVDHTDPGAMGDEEVMEAGVMVEVTEEAMERGVDTEVGMEEVWASPGTALAWEVGMAAAWGMAPVGDTALG